MIDLVGRTALVTGAGGGIGLGIARVLAQAGERVAINDIDADAAEQAAIEIGNDSFGLGGDVSDEFEARGIVARTNELSGRCDFLINNAGIAPALLPIDSQDIIEWQRVMDVNLRGAFIMSQAAAKLMRDVDV